MLAEFLFQPDSVLAKHPSIFGTHKWFSYMDVSKNGGTPKSSILIGFSIINHLFLGCFPIFGNTHMSRGDVFWVLDGPQFSRLESGLKLIKDTWT